MQVSTTNPQWGEILSKKNKTLYILDPFNKTPDVTG
jgi:hypothetical protein